MADVCLTAPAVLSPLSPNESRKRRHGSSGVQGTWFKRHRTGHGFARRLLHLRGFSIDVRQAEELARFIDQFPPEMEKDVSHILEKCGDIDDAIRQLTSLKLDLQAARSRKAEEGDAAAAEASPSDADEPPAGASGRDAGEDPAKTNTSGASSSVETAEANARAAASDAAAAASLESAAPAVLSREWVAALVQEMSASSDVSDAHERATRVLQAFEAAVRSAVAGAEARGAGAGGGDAAEQRAAGLARENLILKRAVAIQNARHQEHARAEEQIVALQRACAQYQEQLQASERQNYSLGLHLKEALGGAASSPGLFGERRPPDVF